MDTVDVSIYEMDVRKEELEEQGAGAEGSGFLILLEETLTDVAIIVIDHDQMSLRLLRTWTVGKLEIQALIATSDGWRRQMLKKSRGEGPALKSLR